MRRDGKGASTGAWYDREARPVSRGGVDVRLAPSNGAEVEAGKVGSGPRCGDSGGTGRGTFMEYS